MDAEGTLEQMVQTFGDFNVQPWVDVLEHDLFDQIGAYLLLVLKETIRTSTVIGSGQFRRYTRCLLDTWRLRFGAPSIARSRFGIFAWLRQTLLDVKVERREEIRKDVEGS